MKEQKKPLPLTSETPQLQVEEQPKVIGKPVIPQLEQTPK